MKKEFIFALVLLGMLALPSLSYGQYLSEWETGVYYEIIRLESELNLENPELMEHGDEYYTDCMEDGVHDVIASRYGITIDQSWDIMQRGLERKITPEEKELMERVADEIEARSDDSFTQEEDLKIAEEVARENGTTVNELYELQRRVWQQMDWDE